MRYIYITEHNIRQMVVESVRQLLTESKQTRKAKSDMTGIAKELKGLSDEQARPVIDKFLQDVFHTITLDNKYTSKYAPPLFRLYLTGEMGSDDKGHDVIAYLLNKCTENEGFVLDPKELNVNAFNKILKDIENEGQNSFNKANQVERTGNSDYEIRRDLTFEQANEIGNYSYPGLPLCYTQNVGTWNDPRYSNNDRNTCYVLLKKGWKELEPVHDNGSKGKDGDPYDTYGKSMIFLFVGPDGRLVSSNTRWNHQARWGSKDCDQAFTEEEISKLVGAPFSEEFPPIDHWANKLNKVEQQLANGENPDSIFNWVYEEHEGFRCVELHGLKNFLTKDNKILCKDWFNKASNFHNGFAVVGREDGCKTYIKHDGTYLTDMWFEYVRYFNKNGLAFVEFKNGNSNYLKTDGTLLVNNSHYSVGEFIGGFAPIMREDGLVTLIKPDGTFLTDMWFQTADYFENGLSYVKLQNGNYNYLKPDATLLVDDLECNVSRFLKYSNFTIAYKPDSTMLVDIQGDIYNMTEYYQQKLDNGEKPEDIFDYVDEEFYDFRVIDLSNLHNYLTKDNKILCKVWFKDVKLFRNGYARVQRVEDNLWNYLKPDGTYLSDEWFLEAYPLNKKTGLAWVVRKNGNGNQMKTDGTLLVDNPEYDVDDFELNGLANVRNKDGDTIYCIDKNGEIV